MLTFIKICCPVCGKRLFDADVSASGVIFALTASAARQDSLLN